MIDVERIVDLNWLERRVQQKNWAVTEAWVSNYEVLTLVAAVRACISLVEHIGLNGGCHPGCPEHDAAKAALRPFRDTKEER